MASCSRAPFDLTCDASGLAVHPKRCVHGPVCQYQRDAQHQRNTAYPPSHMRDVVGTDRPYNAENRSICTDLETLVVDFWQQIVTRQRCTGDPSHDRDRSGEHKNRREGGKLIGQESADLGRHELAEPEGEGDHTKG